MEKSNIAIPSRRGVLGGAAALASVGAVACASAQALASRLRLISRPQRIFKIADLPRERTEAWFAHLIAESDTEIALMPTRLMVSYFAGGSEVSRVEHWGEALRAITMQGLPAPRSQPPVYWPVGIRLISRQPSGALVDRMRIVLQFEQAPPLEGEFAVNTYTQRADLIFPFRGNGIVTQGGAANGGHRNGSGQFAVDAMGLDERYAVQTGANFAVNTDLSGFGRDLIAPGAGVIVHARGDRPDQPTPGESNEDYHLPEFRGAGDPGNHVIIDHSDGEVSMVAHLMAGSLAVREGETVAQGQRLGQLGNSGDSFAPHVHHQLMDGSAWQSASGLPCRYRNIRAQRLDRGEFFAAS